MSKFVRWGGGRKKEGEIIMYFIDFDERKRDEFSIKIIREFTFDVSIFNYIDKSLR